MFVENTYLCEMAKNRKEVLNKCEELGERFVEHFKKIYNETSYETQKHHAMEMQGWYNKAKNLKFSHNNKYISSDQLFDWFFTLGSDCYSVCDGDEDMSLAYCYFVDELMHESDNVLKSLEDCGIIKLSMNKELSIESLKAELDTYKKALYKAVSVLYEGYGEEDAMFAYFKDDDSRVIIPERMTEEAWLNWLLEN